MLETMYQTSTPAEKNFLAALQCKNLTFDFCIAKPPFLAICPNFFGGGYLNKLLRKNFFFTKMVSKFGSLTVYLDFKNYKTPRLLFKKVYISKT